MAEQPVAPNVAAFERVGCKSTLQALVQLRMLHRKGSQPFCMPCHLMPVLELMQQLLIA